MGVRWNSRSPSFPFPIAARARGRPSCVPASAHALVARACARLHTVGPGTRGGRRGLASPRPRLALSERSGPGRPGAPGGGRGGQSVAAAYRTDFLSLYASNVALRNPDRIPPVRFLGPPPAARSARGPNLAERPAGRRRRLVSGGPAGAVCSSAARRKEMPSEGWGARSMKGGGWSCSTANANETIRRLSGRLGGALNA